MGRGLSFTVILLGVLVGLGLTATGVAHGWIVGLVLALLGIAGYACVQLQVLPALRDPDAVPVRSWSKLWFIPAVMLLLGLGCVAVSFLVTPALEETVAPDLVDDYVLVFLVAGMTLLVGAGLGFGIVATAVLTQPDPDDSPLRPTDYAQRTRSRERGRPRTYYDSDWIRHGPRD